MSLTPQQLQQLKELHSKMNAAPTATPAVPTATASQTPMTASATPVDSRGFGDRVKDFAIGAASGFSAPGRFLKNKVMNPILRGALGQDTAVATDAKGYAPDTTSGKIGEFAGETVPFAVTGGIVGSATKGAPLLARAGAQGINSFAIQSMNQQEINKSSFAAGATDAALPIAGRALKLGGDVLKGLAGGLSGTGVDVIEAALERPGAAFKAAGDGSSGALAKLSGEIRDGASRLYKKAGEDYAQAVASAGVNELPKEEVVDGVSKKLVELADANITDEGLQLVDTPFTDVEERQLQKMYNTVTNWTDYTPQGVNTLATRISKFRRGAQDSANFDRVVDGVKRYVRGYVGDKFPEIKEAVTTFSDKMDLLDEINNVLKTTPELGSREGVRKTAEALGRIFNANKEFSRNAINELEKELGIDIIGTLAGQQLSQTAPRSSARIGDLMMNIIQPVGSITARNIVPLVGAVKMQVTDRILQVPGIEPATRALIVNAISDLFEEPEVSIPEASQKETSKN